MGNTFAGVDDNNEVTVAVFMVEIRPVEQHQSKTKL